MDFLEKYKNFIYYLGLFAVTLWPFINLFSSPVNITQAPYREYTIIFFVVFVASLMICEAIKWLFKIDPIKTLMVYSFFYIIFLEYYSFMSFFLTPLKDIRNSFFYSHSYLLSFLKGVKYEFCSYFPCFFTLLRAVKRIFFPGLIFYISIPFLFLSSVVISIFYILRSKSLPSVFLIFIFAVFLFSLGDFIKLRISASKPYGHSISPEMISFEFQTKPNIYFLLLDAYPRHDTLLTERDNTLFLTFLKNNEFTVANKAYSNYASTWPSVSSTFQMSYLQEGDVIPDDVLSPLKEVFIVLKKNGYDIAIVPSYLPAFNGRNVADFIYRKHVLWTSLYLSLSLYLSKSYIRHYISIFSREYAYFSIEEVKKATSFDQSKPLFTFMHFLHFHDHAFNKACKVEILHSQDVKFQSSCFEKLVEKAVHLIISRDPNAIIIAQSDHGPWYWHHKKSEGHPNRFNRGYGIFSAFRLPKLNVPEDIRKYLQESPSPVNNFRIIFALLAGKKPDLLPYRAFISEPQDGDLTELVILGKKVGLEKPLGIPSSWYDSIKDSGNEVSDEEIIKFILEKNGCKEWNNLTPSNQKQVIAKFTSTAEEK